MSDDIVERLRELASNLSEAYPDYAEAADEVTRLRADLAAAQDHRIDTDKWLATEKSRSGKLEAENARLRAELAAERERVEAATHYATQITVWTVETFFEPDKTGWKPLTELLGVLSQLDNALVGVREKRDKLREALVKARGLVSGAFVNRRLDHDVAIFQHSAVMEAIAAIAAANARAADAEREFQRYIRELDKCTERAEAAEAREREAAELLKEAREYVREVAAVTLDEEDCEWLARIDAFLKGDGDE